LVATDLSDLDRLMPFALEQAAEAGARLILLHVLATGAVVATGAIGMPSYDPAGAHEFATNTLEPWRLLAVRRGIGCDALVRQGHPAHQIGTVIRQFRADLVLLGTRSRSRLGKLLVGSVAEHVLRSVNLPVITVGPEAHVAESAASGSGRLILHATTLKEGFRASAELACRLAASQSARLLLVHVLPPLSEGARTEGGGWSGLNRTARVKPSGRQIGKGLGTALARDFDSCSPRQPRDRDSGQSRRDSGETDCSGSHRQVGLCEFNARPHYISSAGTRAVPGSDAAGISGSAGNRRVAEHSDPCQGAGTNKGFLRRRTGGEPGE